jgi:alpha-D-ribose 1-methylphosphonate 5-triphosphate synthase subunit PhnL
MAAVSQDCCIRNLQEPMLRIKNAAKSFTLHVQHGARVEALSGVSLQVNRGETLVLAGPSGAGKSSLLRMIYGNYASAPGMIEILHDGDWVDMGRAAARQVRDMRRTAVGYISQFLRVIPRVPALDVVAEPLLARGETKSAARERAAGLLTRLRIREELWSLSPVTFSGGEQQRVNVARGFAAFYPLLLLDEPTASLDAENRETVVSLIQEARGGGAAIVGIFHDEAVRDRVATHTYEMPRRGEAASLLKI